jgi:hypothetical protein
MAFAIVATWTAKPGETDHVAGYSGAVMSPTALVGTWEALLIFRRGTPDRPRGLESRREVLKGVAESAGVGVRATNNDGQSFSMLGHTGTGSKRSESRRSPSSAIVPAPAAISGWSSPWQKRAPLWATYSGAAS